MFKLTKFGDDTILNQVLDECSKQISDATGKQQGKIDELNSEIRLKDNLCSGWILMMLVEVTFILTFDV